MAKRGATDFSLVVAVDKPRGMSSHDVVNRVRRIFGERRVGHTGTLDPAAEGVLPVCVGPATRLDRFMTGHDKRYRVRIAFGVSTYTDDAEGDVLRVADPPEEASDPAFAEAYLAGLKGKQMQLPPAYSAIKVDGQKAYEAARKGKIIDLTPREVEVYSARLVAVGSGYPRPHAAAEDGAAPSFCELPWWDVEFHVSKGTYIRSLARDAGIALGCPAHVAALKRIQVGDLGLEECVSLQTLEELRERAAIDPVRLLGYRFAFADGDLASRVANGSPLPEDAVRLYVRRRAGIAAEMCACTAGVRESCAEVSDKEFISVIVENKLAAIYGYDGSSRMWRAQCVFQKGVSRGSYL